MGVWREISSSDEDMEEPFQDKLVLYDDTMFFN